MWESWVKPDQWNVYSEIKRKLVEDYKIPEHEVQFIQQHKSEAQRKKVISAMNEGSVRVIFGSTDMLETGVNAQKRAVAIHHIDSPWVRHESRISSCLTLCYQCKLTA